jgi:hypothetical protein
MNFPYSESKLSATSGISRFDLKRLRKEHLKKGKDWVNRPKCGGILLSENAIKKLGESIPVLESLSRSTALDQCKPILSGGVESRHAATHVRSGGTNKADHSGSSAPPAQKLTVVRIPPNPRIVLAKDEDGEIQRVWVGRNQMFVPGDVLEVEPVPNDVGMWRFIGNMPRDKRRNRP